MKTTIYCKPTNNGILSFFLIMGANEFFLFNQSYRKGVNEYYGKGVLVDEAINHSKAHKDTAIIRTMDKIPMYVKYVESEYDIKVLNSTKRRGLKKRKTKCA